MTTHGLTPALALPEDEALELLSTGELAVEGRLVDASNATLYCAATSGSVSAACVYKPVAGERPLWDFPAGTLAERETAAYAVSVATGWDVVPPTVYRDGPLGPGMVQLWIDTDESVDLLDLLRSHDNQALRRMAVFDAVVNNADRKGGHVLPRADGHLFGVDHGVSFNVEDKLRTVLWQWSAQRLPADVVEVLRELRDALDGAVGDALGELLTRREVRATRERVERLLSTGLHPQPSGDWPAVPWPPM